MKQVFKNITLILVAVLMASCAETETVVVKGEKGDPGADGTSCTIVSTVVTCSDGTAVDLKEIGCKVEPTEVGALITCGEYTVEVFNGTDGSHSVIGDLIVHLQSFTRSSTSNSMPLKSIYLGI